jgi:hypothetical protein
MPTNVKTGTVKFPWPLGKVYPGASYATVSAPLTQNIQPVNIDLTPDNQFNGIFIQANPNNAGNIYVCSSAANPDETAYTNVLGILSPGAWYPRGKEWANNRDITGLFIGADNATDFAIVSIDQF